MLLPIPTGVIPVTAQQDVVKPRPDIPPVTPVQASANESSVSLDRRHPQEAEELLREEQRRQQRRRSAPQSAEELEAAEPGQDDGDDLPRQGRWVDVEV